MFKPGNMVWTWAMMVLKFGTTNCFKDAGLRWNVPFPPCGGGGGRNVPFPPGGGGGKNVPFPPGGGGGKNVPLPPGGGGGKNDPLPDGGGGLGGRLCAMLDDTNANKTIVTKSIFDLGF
jgi:hypothetical protein